MAEGPSERALNVGKWVLSALFAATLIWAFIATRAELGCVDRAAVSFSAHGRLLATRIDWNLTVSDIAEREPLLSVPGVWKYAFSQDESRVATASGQRIRIYQMPEGRQVRELRAPTDRVDEIAFTPDGKRLAGCYGDTKLRLWDVETGATIFTADAQEEACRGPVISHDGALVATGGRTGESSGCDVRVWSTQDGTLRTVIAVDEHEYVHSLDFHPDRRHLLVRFSKPEGIAIWDLTDLADIKPAASQIAIPSADGFVFSPRWDRFVTSDWTRSYDHTRTVHRRADGSELLTTPPLPNAPWRSAFLFDGDRFVVATEYCDVFEFDLKSGRLTKETRALRPIRWCWQWSAMLALFSALMLGWIVLWWRRDERTSDYSVAGRPADAWLVPTNAIILGSFAAALYWEMAAFPHEPPPWPDTFLMQLMFLQIVSAVVVLVCGLLSRAWAAIAFSVPAGLVGFSAFFVRWVEIISSV
jgi:hypothetical protein